ncbi:MAG: MoaD/ThiS family protein [Stackebrandtia sp.]
MSMTVFVPGALRADSEGQSTIQVTGAETLRDVFDGLAVRYPRLERRVRDEAGQLRRYINVFIDSDECRVLSGQDTKLRDGVEIRVLPSVAGG